jgi:hypothetical protein
VKKPCPVKKYRRRTAHGSRGSRRTDNGGPKTEGRDRGQSPSFRDVFCLLFLVAFLNFLSCAAPKLSETQKDEFKAAVSGTHCRSRKRPKTAPTAPRNTACADQFRIGSCALCRPFGGRQKLAYVLENEERSSLWLSDRDSALGAPPRKRLEKLGRISAPALSRDGSTLAFVATDYDAKGDIYVLSLDGATSTPRRLTGRNSADGAPAISAKRQKNLFPAGLIWRSCTRNCQQWTWRHRRAMRIFQRSKP